MTRLIKILLLILVIFPIWLTIVAFADTDQTLDFWKQRINSKLLENKDRRIQISELLAKPAEFSADLNTANFDLDLSGVRDRGVSEVAIKFFDTSGRLSKLTRIRAKLFIQEEVAVALRNLNPGDSLSTEDFRLEWRDASAFRDAPFQAKAIVGRVVRSLIRENEIITEGRIQKNQLVSRGDRVKISVVGDGIQISGVGIAEEAGAKGQTIKVLNGDSRKELFGVVTDARAVEVRL